MTILYEQEVWTVGTSMVHFKHHRGAWPEDPKFISLLWIHNIFTRLIKTLLQSPKISIGFYNLHETSRLMFDPSWVQTIYWGHACGWKLELYPTCVDRALCTVSWGSSWGETLGIKTRKKIKESDEHVVGLHSPIWGYTDRGKWQTGNCFVWSASLLHFSLGVQRSNLAVLR